MMFQQLDWQSGCKLILKTTSQGGSQNAVIHQQKNRSPSVDFTGPVSTAGDHNNSHHNNNNNYQKRQ